MRFLAELRSLLADVRFRRLFAVRVTSQCGDGVFQVALTSYVLFSPERQPDAAAIAAALAAVLLPFSVLGPFTGVFLDRWSRRQTLLMCNLIRIVPLVGVAVAIALHRDGVALFGCAVVAFSINRFFLAGLSAALPHVVEPDELVLANSITPTSGTLAFMVGLGIGTAASGTLPFGNSDVAIIALAAAAYLIAALLTTRVPVRELGPDYASGQAPVGAALGSVFHSLRAGLSHLRRRRRAADALAAIAAHRFCYGLSTVATILLYRSYFHDLGDTDAALAGLSVAVLVSGIGFLAAALLTPVVTQRLSPQSWIVVLLGGAAAAETFPGGLYTQSGLLVAAFFLGICSQGVKICVDTLVQTAVDDEFRGRVFALYDVGFNVVFVAAAAVGALIIPANGKSYAVLALVACGYALTALLYWRAERTRAERIALAC
jgi:MFS family permease